jgi:hypothetical protein
MANLRVRWTLPTTRESGKPLAPASIAHVKIELSADLGANWVLINDYPPSVLETLLQDLDFGTWQVRGTVVDSAGRASAPFVGEATNEDTTPPSVLGALTLTWE